MPRQQPATSLCSPSFVFFFSHRPWTDWTDWKNVEAIGKAQVSTSLSMAELSSTTTTRASLAFSTFPKSFQPLLARAHSFLWELTSCFFKAHARKNFWFNNSELCRKPTLTVNAAHSELLAVTKEHEEPSADSLRKNGDIRAKAAQRGPDICKNYLQGMSSWLQRARCLVAIAPRPRAWQMQLGWMHA